MNIYTAKIASTRLFEDTQSVSVLAVCKTENGSLIKDTFVQFSLPVSHKIGESLVAGLVSEIGFGAAGFSEEAIRPGNKAKGLQPVYALVGMQRSTLESLLSVQVRQGQAVSKEEAARGKGMAARAAAWIKNAVENAKA